MEALNDNPLEEACASQLAQANLHRLRRQWDEANKICLHVLYEAPNSWRAHALLGDIAAERGDADEAIQWYCMALDICPNAQATRDKLSVIVNSRRTEITRDITLQLDRRNIQPAAFNAMRALSNGNVRRGRIAAAIVVIGAIGASLLSLPLRSSQTDRQIVEPVFTPILTAEAVDHAPTSGGAQQKPQAGIAPVPITVTTLATTTTPSAVNPPILQHTSTTNTADADEALLLASLQRDSTLRGLGINAENCVIDPANGSAIVTISSSAGQAAASRSIVASAEAAAKSAFLDSGLSALKQCTVRYMATVEGAQAILFQGTILRAALLENQGASSQPPSAFSTTWWSPTYSGYQPAPAPAQPQPSTAAPITTSTTRLQPGSPPLSS